MTSNPDCSAPQATDGPDSAEHQPSFPPVADGDPEENPPLPLDDMPVPPLTEPTDVNGG